MWNPDSIEIYDLFAHKESVYKFNNNKCTVIFGKNETDKGLENNGSGKSTLFEGICIALTNSSLRDINKEDFINDDAESCKVVFNLSNDFLKMKLKIVRQFFRGSKPVVVGIWENGVFNKQMTSVNEANKRILELIGISREDLLKYFIIAQDSRYTFFSANDSDKKEIMNRITSADMINPVIEELDLRAKEKKAEYNDIESEAKELSYKAELIEEQIQDVLTNDDTESEANELNAKIEEANKSVKNNLFDITLYGEEIAVHNKTLLAKSKQLKDKKKLKEDIKTLKDEIEECRSTIRRLKSEIESVITCPNCGEDFIKDSEFEITPVEAEELKKQTESVAVELIEQKDAFESKLGKIEEIEESISDTEELVRLAKRKISRLETTNEELSADVVKYGKKINELKQKKADNKHLTSLKERLSVIADEVAENQKKALVISDELEVIGYWQYYMGKKGFMTYLANKSIKIIEGVTNSYLKKFGVDISVLINGFKVLKNGTVREKIDIFVQNDGITPKIFMSKSGGERGRINIAGILGIQHLINLSMNGRGLNLICLDEVFPGIDSQGQENIIKILEKIGITILMITQNVSDGFNIDNTLNVKKVDGVSSYY